MKNRDQKRIRSVDNPLDSQAALDLLMSTVDEDELEALTEEELHKIFAKMDALDVTVSLELSLDELELEARERMAHTEDRVEDTASSEEPLRLVSVPESPKPLSERSMRVSALTTVEQVIEIVDETIYEPVIKLIGIGGGGSNAVQHMISRGIEGVDFICANTDAQALKSMGANTVLHIGQSITKGLGAGANPEIGRQAAMEDRVRIQDLIQGTDMLFITAGMGGGTGTGAIPVVAQIAREMGVLTVAVVTKPFPFEGPKRMHIAESGIKELQSQVDSLITIPNEKLLSVLGKNISLLDAFRAANDVLRGAVQGIAELITNPGLINVDFADVRTVMSEIGLAMMGSGAGSGNERATEAAAMAISSPLLEDIDLASARGILVNITSGMDMAIGEFEDVCNVVRDFAADNATIVIGTALDDSLKEELRVTVVATGLSPRGNENAKLSSVRLTDVKAVGPITAVSPVAFDPSVTNARPVREASYGLDHGFSSSGRRKSYRKVASGKVPSVSRELDVEYLDIPAFLRRQAD